MKAGKTEGNTRYIYGPCCCGLSKCSACGHDWGYKFEPPPANGYMVVKRYPKPVLANGETVSTPTEALETIRYLTSEWLANPQTFGHWAGGCYMEKLRELAVSGLATVEEDK